MLYGTFHESDAWASYQVLSPYELLSQVGLAVWGEGEVHSWLAASPDGLITVQLPQQPGQDDSYASVVTDHHLGGEADLAWVQQQTGQFGCQ